MRAEDLIRVLEDHISKFGNTEVIMSTDGEGNGYSPLSNADTSMWLAYENAPWMGDLYVTQADVDDPESGYGEEDLAPEAAVFCLSLWPNN